MFSFNRLISLLFSFVVLCSGSLTFASETTMSKTTSTSLIPRAVLFSDPEHSRVRISPDGKHLAYLAPYKGVLNVWVGDVGNTKSFHPITDNTKRGIAGFTWAYNNEHILYFDDNEGNEDWRSYRVNVNTGEKITLVSFKNVQARIIATSPYFPDEILIGLNQRRADFHDIYRLNIRNGKLTPVYENNSFADFTTDDHLNVKLGLETTPEGGAILYALGKEFAKTELMKISPEDLLTTSPLMLNKQADIVYLIDSRNRDKAALTAFDLNTKKTTLIAENALADVSDVMAHPTELTLQAYSSTYERPEWTVLDNSVKQDLEYLKKVANGDIQIPGRSLDDKIWIVAYIQDKGAMQYYYYDRTNQKAHFLFSSKPALDSLPLTEMKSVIIPTRDNLKLVSYLSLPRDTEMVNGRPKKPLPLVLNVHGGPNARDDWGYDSEHQWLANRGYAVLSVNFRGSTGFGKAFTNAGNGEWGNKMHDDLLDAVQWAIDQGITTKDKVCIMGGSYGGYAALIGLTKTPGVFACGIDVVGPSNLETLLKSIPAYWKPFYLSLIKKVGGDPATETGREFLASRSPLTLVEQIKKPLLIGQGANDPRVKQTESEQIVKKMQEKRIPVTYVLYPDEGHGFHRPENRLSFNAVVEAFLAKHLGGKFEPVKDDFKNSSIEIKVGKEFIPGL